MRTTKSARAAAGAGNMLKVKYVNPKYREALERCGLLAEEAVLGWNRGERIVAKNWADVFRCTLDGVGTVYLKRHFRQKNRLLRAFRANAALREFASSTAMRRLGLPQAEPLLAAVVESFPGVARCGVYVMREVENAVSLDTLLDRLRDAPDRALLQSIGDELVRVLRVMHDGGFCHWDLKPRNLLITRNGGMVITPIDSRSGRKMNLLTRRACIRRDYRFLMREPLLRALIESRVPTLPGYKSAF